MKKTSVYLAEAELERLAWLAAQERTSQAEIIRRAISVYVPQMNGDRDFRLIRSGAGPGDSIADLGEEESLEGFGE